MTRPATRLLAKTTSRLSSRSHQPIRTFSQTRAARADEQSPPPRKASLLDAIDLPSYSTPSRASRPPPVPNGTTMYGTGGSRQSRTPDIGRVLIQDTMQKTGSTPLKARLTSEQEKAAAERAEWGPLHEPFHYHVTATKNNTHITVTKPNRNAIVSLSTGNIGFKKQKRGSYDAAYQLSAHVLDKLNQGGWHKNIDSLEVILCGFGHGREAATKVLLGNEGRLLRPRIEKVSDGTKLKFGGTRSKKPRRV